MRSEIDHHLLLATTKDERIGEGGEAGANFDRASTGIVEDAVLVTPAVDVPRPARNWAVD